MDSLNERVVRAAIQNHITAGRPPVEAAGEVRFLERWLTETLDASPEVAEASLQLADEYTQFLHERVVAQPNQMSRTDNVWRDWRQKRSTQI